MKLKKNLGAKIAVVATSLVALLTTWGFVSQNPPPPTPSDTADPSSSPVASPTRTSGTSSGSSATTNRAPATAKHHTRTRAS
jgi:hypothetical protein